MYSEGVPVGAQNADSQQLPLPYPLLRYMSLIGDQMGQVEDLLDEITYISPANGGPPAGSDELYSYSALVDPWEADPTWLPWLAMVCGANINGLNQIQARLAIAAQQTYGMYQGSKVAIQEAIRNLFAFQVTDATATAGTNILSLPLPENLALPIANDNLLNGGETYSTGDVTGNNWTAAALSSAEAYMHSLEPQAWWKLSDPVGSTTAADASGNGYTGTVYGNVTFGEPGAIANLPWRTAAKMDGTTGYIRTTSNGPSVSAAFSFTAWVYYASAPSTPSWDIFTERAGPNEAVGLIGQSFDNGIRFGGSLYAGANDYFFAPQVYATGAWFHLAYVYDSAQGGILYVNGASVYAQNITGTNQCQTLLGNYFNSTDLPQGTSAQLAVFDYALSPTQVTTLYSMAQQSVVPAVSPSTVTYQGASAFAASVTTSGYDSLHASYGPVWWWRLADPTLATSAADASGNGYTGTIHGTSASTAFDNMLAQYSPALWWKLDETSGTTAFDSSGNGASGTYSGGYVLDQMGPLGGLPGQPGASFSSASSGKVTSGTISSFNPASTAFTVNIWFKTSTFNTEMTLWDWNGNSIFAGVGSNNSFSCWVDGLAGFFVGSLPQDGQWHMLTTVFPTANNTSRYMYLDGNVLSTTPFTAGSVTNTTSSLEVGGGGAGYWNGELAQASLITGALTQPEIQKLYSSGPYNGGVTFGQSSPIPLDTGATFDGRTGYINAVDGASVLGANPTNFTISGWFNTTCTTGAVIAAYYNGADNWFGIQTDTGGAVSLGVNLDGIIGFYVTSPKTYTDGNWHHVVGVRNGASFSLYVDGASVAMSVESGSFDFTSRYFYVGALLGTEFVGGIAQTSLFNYSLTAAQISALYQAATTELGQTTPFLFGTSLARQLPVSAGGAYTFSVATQPFSGMGGSVLPDLIVQYVDANGNEIQADTTNGTALVANTWKSVSFTSIAPATAAAANIWIAWEVDSVVSIAGAYFANISVQGPDPYGSLRGALIFGQGVPVGCSIVDVNTPPQMVMSAPTVGGIEGTVVVVPNIPVAVLDHYEGNNWGLAALVPVGVSLSAAYQAALAQKPAGYSLTILYTYANWSELYSVFGNGTSISWEAISGLSWQAWEQTS